MNKNEKTQSLLISHCQKYPLIQVRDLFKFLYQSSFGCEHLVSSLTEATDRIKNENIGGGEDIDPLDGDYCRIPLSYLNKGLSAQTLAKLFIASAKNEPFGKECLVEKLDVAKTLILENKLPFEFNEFEKMRLEWESLGYPPLHHSDAFRTSYNPSYRVISNRFIPFLSLFTKIDTLLCEKNIIIAIDGGSASGKTTLCQMLEALYDCTAFHMDDFFLRPEQRTNERYAEVGGNIDRERFLEEVLTPLGKNEPVNYRRFDCSTMTISPAVRIVPKKLTVIEGVYSMHPEFSDFYDLSVFLNVSPELQRKRIAKRNTQQMAKRFFDEWIPLEKTYFSKMQIPRQCDICIDVES